MFLLFWIQALLCQSYKLQTQTYNILLLMFHVLKWVTYANSVNDSCIIVTEYGYTTKITEKSDVYSYGVVLLEILSGRSAIQRTTGDGLHIVEWMRKKMSSFEPALNILDSKLQGMPDQLVQEMLRALGIAMLCVNSAPSDRPTMKEVVALLMEVKSPPEEWGRTSQQPLIKPVIHG